MGDTISKEGLQQELLEIQEYLRAQGEYRKANMIDFAQGYVDRSPNFLKIKKLQNPDTERTLECVDKKPCIAALICDNSMNRVLMVRQYRAGSQSHVHEVVAGVIEDDQDALDALFAEVRQEAGIVKTDIASIDNIGTYYSSVGWTNEVAHLYIVRLKEHFNQLEQQLDYEECLSYMWVNARDLINLYKGKSVPIKTAMLINEFLLMRGE